MKDQEVKLSDNIVHKAIAVTHRLYESTFPAFKNGENNDRNNDVFN